MPRSLASWRTCLINIYVLLGTEIKINSTMISLLHRQEMHQRAWKIVGDYLSSNLRIFTARAGEAESTVLPSVTSYIQEAFDEVPECRSTEDHGVVVWWNLPACGVLSSAKYDYGVTSISNLLAQYRRNGLAVIVHPNRASHVADRTHSWYYVYMCSLLWLNLPLLITQNN